MNVLDIMKVLENLEELVKLSPDQVEELKSQLISQVLKAEDRLIM